MLAGLPPPPAPLSLLQGRPGTEVVQPKDGKEQVALGIVFHAGLEHV